MNGEQCNHVNGACHNGCEAGYYNAGCTKGILAEKKHKRTFDKITIFLKQEVNSHLHLEYHCYKMLKQLT